MKSYAIYPFCESLEFPKSENIKHEVYLQNYFSKFMNCPICYFPFPISAEVFENDILEIQMGLCLSESLNLAISQNKITCLGNHSFPIDLKTLKIIHDQKNIFKCSICANFQLEDMPCFICGNLIN